MVSNVTFSPIVQFLPDPSRWGVDPSPIPALLAGLAVILTSTFLLRSTKSDKVYDLGGIPVFTAWNFFKNRFDFFRDHIRKSGGRMFRFRVFQHRVIVVTGEQGRKIFLNDKSLDMGEGYKILSGRGPSLEDIDKNADGSHDARSFINRLLLLLRKDRVADVLPVLLDDLHSRMLDWGTKGKINPFKEVYDLVFQMTVRMATCRELAEDKQAIQDLRKHYFDMEQSRTPVSALLPWFPGPAKKLKAKASLDLYILVMKYVTMRRKAGAASSDPIDILITNGDSDEVIIGTVMGIIFAGIVNTGVTACWVLLYLGSNPKWKERVMKEYNVLVANHTNALSTEPLHKRLASIPLNAWEDELPSVDLVIRETLRFTVSGPFLRRNIQKDIVVDGVAIKRGDFMAYPTFEAHMNPDIYSNPDSFDPDRYLEGREEDKKETFGYVAWGAGRHPCAGMKIAKLEMKLVLALMLLGYNYDIVDEAGKYPDILPEPDRNDATKAQPLGAPCYLKFEYVNK
ncbi:hypothetical protein M413DRAFT_448749 [Hebeloma cylindrosporum]|uniref:Cytochrome P450 n=1 Tax=Hebeloma cylindrosporum TaxID=76867 RepID=A0A0C2Y7M4_HEBCY|nr:hypothetical protein M413DRAFT_448749 [Hebeloma cylindrosporum h7]